LGPEFPAQLDSLKKMKTHPLPGETCFQSRPKWEIASKLAEDNYDVQALEAASDTHGQYWALKTIGGYVAMIGFLGVDHGNCLAILHKNPDGSRTLETFPDLVPIS
jgi:hypothetical protein